MLNRIYNLIFAAGIVCLIVAGAVFFIPSQPSSAMPALALTPTIPQQPTAEPTDPPTAEPPTAAPPTSAPPTAAPPSVEPPTAEPPTKEAPTPTSKPKRDKPDPTPAATPTATPEPPTPAPEPHVDISLSKSVNVDTASRGQTVVYTLVGRNAGPDTAYDVVITDSVPDEVEITDLSCSKGDVVARGQTVTAYVSILAPGESVTVRITGRVRQSAAGEVVNTGEITTSTPDDPSNNTSTVTFRVPVPVPPRQPPRLPPTGQQPEPGLLALPAWLPWVAVGLLLVLLGIALRFRGAEKPAPMPIEANRAAQPAHQQAPIARIVSMQPTPRLPLPPPQPAGPLPPIVDLDRPGALRWTKGE